MRKLSPPPKKCNSKTMTLLSAIHDAVDERTFEQIKNIEMAHEPWRSWRSHLRALKP